MARFFFHLHDINGLTEDEEGRELPDLAAAGEEAVHGIRSMLSADLMRGVVDLRGRILVADESGETLLTVAFDEAFQLIGA